MADAPCPTCSGTGRVAQHVADALNATPGTTRSDTTCHCDGPPHSYDRGWCPPTGPVPSGGR